MLFMILGCNDTPNSVGKGVQNSSDYGVVHVDTFYATDHSSVSSLLSTSSVDRFMLGQYKTYQSWICLKFYLWPDSLYGAKITSATIQLKGVSHFGDSLAQLSFSVHRAMSDLFRSDSLTFDSLNMNTVNSVKGVYYNSSPLSVQTVVPVGDTESISIKILDTAMVREWVSVLTDTMDLNDGLVLRPTNSSVIRGFYSCNIPDTSLQPTLYIDYIDTNGNAMSYSHKVGLSKYVATVNQANLITDNNLIYIQNGISYRGLVSYDSLLTAWPVSIHRAVLQVTEYASAYVTHDSLYALSVGPSGVSDGISFSLSQRSADSSGHPMYSFEIRPIAIRMLSNASIRKVALSGYSESTSFDLFKLYGTGAFKPRFIITYSVQR